LFTLLTFCPPQNALADADDGASAVVAINAASKLRNKLPLFIVSCIYLSFRCGGNGPYGTEA
jgi:hypothetical protein